MKLRDAVPSFAFLMLLLGSACAPEQELELRIYGEEYVEERIPPEDFVDGWSVTFERFLVSVREVSVVATKGASPVALLESPLVVDLARESGGEGHVLSTGTAALEEDATLTYRIAFHQDAKPASSMADLDVEPLLDGGCSLFVDGTAVRAEEERSFSWCFKSDTTYSECALATDEGFDTQITVHADHLFYDDLDAEDPNVAFDLIAAADADGDGVVTQAELEATDITAEDRYQVGGRAITHLWAYLEAQTGTVGHINGEGHCDAVD